MNLWQLKCFSLSAQLHSFSLASERLYISQSAVTQQMKALENEVGCRLFTRSSGDSALQNFQSHLSQEQLWLGYIGPPPTQMFAWVSRKMQAQHPNLHISYTHFSLSQAPEIIKSGKTQLIFGEDNALWQRPDVRFIPLYREEHTLVLPADHALANRPSLSLSDLKDETFVLPSHRPWIDHLNRLCELPGGEYLENYIPVSDFLSYTTDVLVYRAVAIIPKRMYLPSDQTAAVPLVPDVSFYFGFLCPRSLTERSVQIMDCCKAFLKVQEAEKNA